MTISVIANFKAKSDQKETLEALLKSVIEPTLHEEGCLKYELYISENDSSRYFFLEEWRSREDLDIQANSNMRCDSLKSLMIINKLSKFL